MVYGSFKLTIKSWFFSISPRARHLPELKTPQNTKRRKTAIVSVRRRGFFMDFFPLLVERTSEAFSRVLRRGNSSRVGALVGPVYRAPCCTDAGVIPTTHLQRDSTQSRRTTTTRATTHLAVPRSSGPGHARAPGNAQERRRRAGSPDRGYRQAVGEWL